MPSFADNSKINGKPSEESGVLLIKTPSSVRQGVGDALTMRGLTRAFLYFLHRKDAENGYSQSALTKTLKINGALAEVIDDGKRQRPTRGVATVRNRSRHSTAA